MLARVAQISDLSFVESKSRPWAPERSGDYETDCARGRLYADEMLAFIRLKNCPLLFGQVIRAISEGGVYAGIEIGFCSRIGIVLIGLRPTT